MDNKLEIHVTKQRVLYPKSQQYNDGDFAIVTCKVVKKIQGEPKIHELYKTITIKGNLSQMEDKAVYRIIASENYDKSYNSYSYDVSYMQEMVDLNNEVEQRLFLRRVLTDKQVEAFMDKFDNPIEVLDSKDLDLISSVKGVTKKKAQTLLDKYSKCRNDAKIYVFLGQYGLTNVMIDKIKNQFSNSDMAIKTIKENPYDLIRLVNGIGFKKADEIAMKMGVHIHSDKRCTAFIQHHLDSLAQTGNSYTTVTELMNGIYDALGNDFPRSSVSESLKYLIKMRILWHSEDKKYVGLQKYYRLEQSVARNLLRLNSVKGNFKSLNKEEVLKQVQETQGWEYTDEQLSCIQSCIDNNVVLITGLAGSGKTATVNGVLKSLSEYTFAQCALSGKASVNLTEATGVQGYTIHRLLGYNPMFNPPFTYDEHNPLEHDIIILDELSMVDANLFDNLISAISTGAKLIMLGDDGQLESIGVGNIIYDLMNSGVITHCKLSKVHRQASKSAIITESRKVRYSEQIIPRNFSGIETLGELQDFTLIGYQDNKQRAKGELKPTINFMIKKFEEKLSLANNNVMDVCMMLPTRSNGSGCYKANLIVQSMLIDTSSNVFVEVGKRSNTPYKLFVGDKVINTKNNLNTKYTETFVNDIGIEDEVVHERPIYNGNMGIITDINVEDDTMIIDFDGIGLVEIESEDINNIELGYCITVHKMQGAGYPYVICGLDNTHYIMQNRELVYTMITRTKKHCDFVFETPALIRAINTTNIQNKNTFLPLFLNGMYEL